MVKRTDLQNQHTQPQIAHKVFNNWNIVTEGWYIVCPSKSLKIEDVLSKNVARQKVAVFRDSEGQTHAMDGFCCP